MKNNYRYTLLLVIIMIAGCNFENKTEEITGESEPVFPKGEKIVSDNFIGTAWLTSLVIADSLNYNSAGVVTFEPGARTSWHFHPAGQIILVLEGVGYYQEKGSQKTILRKGDAVKCPPDLPHWHGASSEEQFVQIAITGRKNGPTVWLDPVTEQEYLSGETE